MFNSEEQAMVYLKNIVKKHKNLINLPAKERINYELMKLFGGKYVVKSLLLMDELQILELIFPFVKEFKKVPPNAHHHLNLFMHTIETVNFIQKFYEKANDEEKRHLDSVALAILSQSSSSKLPVLSFNISTLACEHKSLYANCSLDISRENITTLFPSFKAAFSAIFNENVVFPIDGLAAISTISPFWNPDVLASKSLIPDPTPVIAPLLLNNLSISKKPLSSTLESGSYSLESFFSAISKTFF